jgi:hypothetical protein
VILPLDEPPRAQLKLSTDDCCPDKHKRRVNDRSWAVGGGRDPTLQPSALAVAAKRLGRAMVPWRCSVKSLRA